MRFCEIESKSNMQLDMSEKLVSHLWDLDILPLMAVGSVRTGCGLWLCKEEVFF